MPDGSSTVIFGCDLQAVCTTHALKYLPVQPRAETKRPEGRNVCQRTTRSAICSGFLNNHTACHGRMQTAKIVVTASVVKCMTELLAVVQSA